MANKYLRATVIAAFFGAFLASCTAKTTAVSTPGAGNTTAVQVPGAGNCPSNPPPTAMSPTVTTVVGGSVPAAFGTLYGVAVNASGTLYVTDGGKHQIATIGPNGTVAVFAGGQKGYADGVGAAAAFDTPMGITVDDGGTVFVSDYGNHRIRRILPDGTVSTFAGDGQAIMADGKGTAASFQQLGDLVADHQGNLYVVDIGTVRKIAPDGTVTTVAAHDPADVHGDGFPFVNGLGVDVAGNILAVGRVSLYRFASDGKQTLMARSPAMMSKDGFYFPADVAVTPDGRMYVSDNGTQSIHQVDPSSGTVTTIAGFQPCGCIAPRCGYQAIDGVGFQAGFASLGNMVADRAGNLFAVDGNARIRKVTFPPKP